MNKSFPCVGVDKPSRFMFLNFQRNFPKLCCLLLDPLHVAHLYLEKLNSNVPFSGSEESPARNALRVRFEWLFNNQYHRATACEQHLHLMRTRIDSNEPLDEELKKAFRQILVEKMMAHAGAYLPPTFFIRCCNVFFVSNVGQRSSEGARVVWHLSACSNDLQIRCRTNVTRVRAFFRFADPAEASTPRSHCTQCATLARTKRRSSVSV